MPQVEYRFVVPLALNDGTVIPETVHDAIARMLLSAFGGFTKYAEHDGAWQNESGTLFVDRGYILGTIAEKSAAHDLAQLRIAESIKRLCNQECVLTYQVALTGVQFI